MQEAAGIPFYMDWTFWAFIVSGVAVLLSQIPPIHILLKKAKLDFEVYSKISLTQKLGNPNLQLHIIISNLGGRKVRVKEIECKVTRDKSDSIILPAQNYLQKTNDTSTILLTSFSLEPNQEWGHIVNALQYFSREEEKEYFALERKMKEEYRKNADTEDEDKLVEIGEELTNQAFDFHNKKLFWKSGEYELEVLVKTDTPNTNVSKSYTFNVFESHEEQLNEITSYYKYGGGLWWDPKVQTAVVVGVSEA